MGRRKPCFMTRKAKIFARVVPAIFFAIDKQGVLRTHAEGGRILSGVIRQRVMQLSQQHGLKLSEKALNMSELETIREAFITSTSMRVMPVTQIDQQRIGNGQAGAITLQLRQWLNEEIDAIIAG